ncbi:MAG: nucleoside-diphosphate kinase, partial [Verrucomicrobiales bacterium]|nr:nucleoside-diphosphate kinase [Verrucomicrobiales bacterium]
RTQELIRDYVLRNLGPHPVTGARRRVMVLVFRGEDAVRKVRSVVGSFTAAPRGGETIRDSFGDLVLDDQGQVRYFEPAVLAAPTPEEAASKLALWARYSASDGGLLENAIEYPADVHPERTLVLIKPDNFRFPSGRPGNVIDFLSRTGLYIVAIKLHRMSVADAMEFYGPVREILRTKLHEMVGRRAGAAVEKEFGFVLGPTRTTQLGQLLCPAFGDFQFENIVQFMSGSRPTQCPPERLHEPGTEKCIALVYEGPDAVRKIRDVLGPTDPSQAPPGSIRREFGSSVMVNAAHASDSPENARREMAIIKLGQENIFQRVVDDFYAPRP